MATKDGVEEAAAFFGGITDQDLLEGEVALTVPRRCLAQLPSRRSTVRLAKIRYIEEHGENARYDSNKITREEVRC